MNVDKDLLEKDVNDQNDQKQEKDVNDQNDQKQKEDGPVANALYMLTGLIVLVWVLVGVFKLGSMAIDFVMGLLPASAPATMFTDDVRLKNSKITDLEADTLIISGVEDWEVLDYYDKLVKLSLKGSCAVFDAENKKVLIEPGKFKDFGCIEDGVVTATTDSLLQFVDLKGKVLLSTRFLYEDNKDAGFDGGDYCIIKSRNGYTGVIDKRGKWSVMPMYNEISELGFDTDGKRFLVYTNNNKSGVITHDGKILLNPKYDKIMYCNGVIEACVSDSVSSLFNIDGQLLSDCYLNYVQPLAYAKDGGRIAPLRTFENLCSQIGLVAQDGTIVLRPIFERIEAIDDDLYLCITQARKDTVFFDAKGDYFKRHSICIDL